MKDEFKHFDNNRPALLTIDKLIHELNSLGLHMTGVYDNKAGKTTLYDKKHPVRKAMIIESEPGIYATENMDEEAKKLVHNYAHTPIMMRGLHNSQELRNKH